MAPGIAEVPRWGVRFGRYWMFQWSLDRTLSLGIHLDPCSRQGDQMRFGPYCDLHLGVCALSFGRNPAAAWNHSLMRPLWNAGG